MTSLLPDLDLSSTLDYNSQLCTLLASPKSNTGILEDGPSAMKSLLMDDDDDDDDDDKNENDASASAITPASDLSRTDRKIWVVTTASLPWRTGTSVNPLAQALYLTRGRPKDSVTLMVPFLTDESEQAQVFGNDISFDTQEDQETWIRQYCIDRVHCEDEAHKMRIRFYDATYNKGFGSIFATVDVCALIPDDEADVCILEEPEHMNWMRVVDEKHTTTKKPTTSTTSDDDVDKGVNEKDDDSGDKPEEDDVEKKEKTIKTGSSKSSPQKSESNTSENSSESTTKVVFDVDATPSAIEISQLGWAVKFKHVVGIVHTNYDAYVRKYGMGAGLMAASALHALSSLVTRAYCHRVIRLSDTLPTLDAAKEVTCNVHGVRLEFFEDPRPPTSDAQPDVEELSSIYFIGKLIWAKGFDKLLEIQELYKKKTGSYFPMDVYGSGPDEKPIKRAFFGRKGLLLGNKAEQKHARESTPDRNAAGLFQKQGSLREQLLQEKEVDPEDPVVNEPIEVVWGEIVPVLSTTGVSTPSSGIGSAADEAQLLSSPPTDIREPDFPNPFVILRDLSGEFVGASAVTTTATAKVGQDIVGFGVHSTFTEVSDSSSLEEQDDRREEGEPSSDVASPSCGSPTTAEKEDTKKSHSGIISKSSSTASLTEKAKRALRFDPPMSRFELRRHPVPARFLGMQDHAVIRDLPQHKIFFNPSESEVLCTTSAEALAMGKFVVLPKHPSNTFFLQFPNCLAYSSKGECVDKLRWAMEHGPEPLSDDDRFQLTWEGANERLYKAAAMTEKEVQEWKDSGRAKGDRDAAKLHYETVKRGRGVQKFLNR